MMVSPTALNIFHSTENPLQYCTNIPQGEHKISIKHKIHVTFSKTMGEILGKISPLPLYVILRRWDIAEYLIICQQEKAFIQSLSDPRP